MPPHEEAPMPTPEIESVTPTLEVGADAHERPDAPAARQFRHEYTRTFPGLLSQLDVSHLVPSQAFQDDGYAESNAAATTDDEIVVEDHAVGGTARRL